MFWQHPGCGCAPCHECWINEADNDVEERRLSMRCPKCKGAVSPQLGRFLCMRSEKLHEVNAQVEAHTLPLRQVAATGVRLEWASIPTEPGPVCTICHERQWALYANNPCGHGACQSCWSTWAACQLPRCEIERHDTARCFASQCRERVAVPLALQLDRCSEDLRAFGSREEVKQRRRLRNNPIYPAHLQVDCPSPDCWGLGYLGFETVMCFVCERQWSPEDGGAPLTTDLDIEEVMGVKVKKCPKCSEYIEKNGGCDHMTCRCGHEFWWSTGKPCR